MATSEQEKEYDMYIKKLEKIDQLEVIPEDKLIAFCKTVKERLFTEPNLLVLKAPINIVGDIHGQHHDLLKLFAKGGSPSKTNQYLFLGDYVDRGYYSLETMQLLILYKLKFPDQVHLLRGNHESRMITQAYGFREELIRKYGNPSMWQVFMEVFDLLPLAAIVSNKIFCVHAGLSKDIKMLYQINLIDRNKEVENSGKFSDLLWSDPYEEFAGFRPNQRGAGTLFGIEVVDEFCKRNGIDLIVRSHQLAENGYHYPFKDKTNKKEAEMKLVTIWSVPNYCYRCNNKACFMKVDEKLNQTFEYFDHDVIGGKIPLTKMMPYFL